MDNVLECITCPDGCSSCESIDPTYLNEDDNIVCTECSDGYHLTEEYECAKRLGTDSTFDCDDVEYGLLDETGYYYTCEDCPSGCSNCSLENSSDTYSSLLCYGCSDGYYLSDYNCYSVCDETYEFYDTTTSSCQECDISCKGCTS